MNGISLFSGCLGLDLGLEAVGFNAVGYVENDVNCQRVIAVRRPGVPIIGDVRDTEALKHFVGIDWLAGAEPGVRRTRRAASVAAEPLRGGRITRKCWIYSCWRDAVGESRFCAVHGWCHSGKDHVPPPEKPVKK